MNDFAEFMGWLVLVIGMAFAVSAWIGGGKHD